MRETCDVRSCGAPLAMGGMSRSLRLCTSCRHRLADRLIRLPRLYQACAQSLEVRRQHPVGAVRGRRRRTGICLDETTVAVRSDMIRVLSSWCEMIVDERRVAGPGSLDITTLSSFLQSHLAWLTAHVVAADFAEEIAALIADATGLLNPAHVRMIELGPCTRDGCGQMIRASLSTDNQPSAPRVRCDAGHTWRPRQWLDLRYQPDPAARGVPA